MSTTKSLLIVDDVSEIIQLFERLAKSYRTHPLEIVTTTDPEVAISLVTKRDFDVVLSDFRMPHIDGVRVLVAARARNPNGRRILMTGYNEIPASEAEIHAAGLSGRLKKPLAGSQLIEFLQACFSDDSHALDDYQSVEEG